MISEIELWRDIPGCDGHQASSLGRIRSKDRIIISSVGYKIRRIGKVLKLQKGLKGKYLRIQLKKGGEIHSVHRLVALAWKDNPCNYPLVRHLDDNGLNNRATNLQWGTQVHNRKDAKNPRPSTIKSIHVKQIMVDAYHAGFSKLSIAKYFKVTDTTVRRIVEG